jgi:hypothetical protein
MHLRVIAMIAVTAFGTGIAHGQARLNQVTFQSSSYADFRQLLLREAPAATVMVSGTLSFPDEARDRYPAVVVVHTIAGYQEANEGQYAAELRKAGFATLTYDSFAARGTTGLVSSRSGPGLWPMPTPRCDGWLAIPGSMPVGSPLPVSHMAARWLIWRPSRGFVPRSILGQRGLPPTSPIIRRVSLERSPNPGPIPDRRS